MCLSAIYWARISVIYYANTKVDAGNIGFDDKFIYDELEKPMEKRKVPVIQLLRNEAQQAFNLWKTAILKTDY